MRSLLLRYWKLEHHVRPLARVRRSESENAQEALLGIERETKKTISLRKTIWKTGGVSAAALLLVAPWAFSQAPAPLGGAPGGQTPPRSSAGSAANARGRKRGPRGARRDGGRRFGFRLCEQRRVDSTLQWARPDRMGRRHHGIRMLTMARSMWNPPAKNRPARLYPHGRAANPPTSC